MQNFINKNLKYIIKAFGSTRYFIVSQVTKNYKKLMRKQILFGSCNEISEHIWGNHLQQDNPSVTETRYLKQQDVCVKVKVIEDYHYKPFHQKKNKKQKDNKKTNKQMKNKKPSKEKHKKQKQNKKKKTNKK